MSLKKSDYPICYYETFGFWQFQGKIKEGAKLKDSKIQGILRHEKLLKKYQEAKMDEIQAKSRGHQNRTVQFWIPKYPVFPEQIKSDYNLRFSLFRKDFLVSNSKSYVILPI
jgi:predicted Rossmann fold nucleotide-binding protein DprA/Smf involved in DNA uptake